MRLQGNVTGYLIACVAALLTVSTSVSHTAGLAFFVDDIIKECEFSRTTFSYLFAIATFVSGCASTYIGHLVDVFGERRVATIAAIVFSAATFALNLATGPITVGALLIVLRLSGASGLCLCADSVLSRWFSSKKLGSATSVKSFVQNLRLGFPLMATTLLVSTGDWRATLRIIAGLTALVCAVCIAFFHDNPAALGLRRDGDEPERKVPHEGSDPDANSAQSRENLEASRGDSDTDPAKKGLSIREALLTPRFRVVVMVNVIQNLFEPALNIHGVNLFGARGVDMVTFSWCSAATICSVAVSRVLSGFALDFFPDKFPILACALCFSIGVPLLVMWVHDPASAIVFSVVRGSVMGLRTNLQLTLVPDIVGQRALGKALALWSGCGVVISGLGLVLWSLCKEKFGSYLPMLKMISISNAALLVLVLSIIVWGKKEETRGVEKKNR